MPQRIALALALALSACAGGPASKYARRDAPAGELVWAMVDGKLEVRRAGGRVAQARSWAGLDSAVRCVPESSKLAASASSRYGTGLALAWTGGIIAFGSIAGGGAIALSNTSDSGQVLLGLGVLLGGVIVGTSILGAGGYQMAVAQANAIDAVNLYNDSFAGNEACR